MDPDPILDPTPFFGGFKNGKKKFIFFSRVVDPDPDPDAKWIPIQLEAWIRIRVGYTDPDPDTGGEK